MPFPPSVRSLPKTQLAGIDVYVHDDGRTQILFMELGKDRTEVVVPTHTTTSSGGSWSRVGSR